VNRVVYVGESLFTMSVCWHSSSASSSSSSGQLCQISYITIIYQTFFFFRCYSELPRPNCSTEHNRFCRLRFDQITLAGLHNAGSGFDGEFGLLSCWVQNHGLSILQQLRQGIRFLDVDISWQHCGLLGSFHNFACGGPVCKMIKQARLKDGWIK
jgi:hypothetical protein